MRRSTLLGLTLGLLSSLVAGPPAGATIRVVDGDNDPCIGAQYLTINAALAVAEDGDEIQICPGVYHEQIFVKRELTQLTVRGMPVGDQHAVIQPTTLPKASQSTMGGKSIAAGILVEAPRVTLDSLVVDMSAAAVTGCSPILAGIYLRDASGRVSNVDVSGARPPVPASCDTGVGMLIEGGQMGDTFGAPVIGKAVVLVEESAFTDNLKGGIVILGNRAIVRVQGSKVVGDGPSATTQNGIEMGHGAKGRLQEVKVDDVSSTASGKIAAGVLLVKAGKVRTRRSTITNTQAGVFVVGNGARVLDTDIGDTDPQNGISVNDGIILLGDKNRVLGNSLDRSSVDGVFIDGDRNTVRGGTMSNMPVGVWTFDGDRNVNKGTVFTNVPQPDRVGGLRPGGNLTIDDADPLTLDCSTVADCDDANPCTVDTCDAPTGECSNVNVPNSTSCADGNVCNGAETCIVGVCTTTPGTPLVCVDGNECTSQSCDPTLGCQFPPLPDATPCNSGLGSCLGGVCL